MAGGVPLPLVVDRVAGGSAAMASVPDGDTAQGTGAPTFPSSLPPSVSPAQALASTLESQLIQPTLFSYVANDLVWARASARATDPFWPVRTWVLGKRDGVGAFKSSLDGATIKTQIQRNRNRTRSLSKRSTRLILKSSLILPTDPKIAPSQPIKTRDA